MAFYDNMAATTLRLITSKGTTVTLSRSSAGVFDPITATYTTPQTVTSGNVKAVIVRYTTQGVKKLASGSILGDNTYLTAFASGKLRKVLIAALGAPFEPESGDTITNLSGQTWSVLGCNPVNINDATPILYEVACIAK
jgi:hypothetical protein